MKEDTLIKMKKQVESLNNVMQFVMDKLKYLDTIAVGTLETMKNMPDYQDAIDKIKNKVKEEDGVEQQDTK
jgi:hypothetical protein